MKQVLTNLLEQQAIRFDYQSMNIQEFHIDQYENNIDQNESLIENDQSMIISKTSSNESQYDSQESIDKNQIEGEMVDELENDKSDNDLNENSKQMFDSQFVDVQERVVSCKKCYKILFESQCQQHCQSKGCTIQFHCPKCNKEQFNIPNLIFHDYLTHQINYEDQKNICCEFCYKNFKRTYYKQHLVRVHMDRLKQLKDSYYSYITKLQQISDRIISEYNIRYTYEQGKENEKKKKKPKEVNKQSKEIKNKSSEIEYAFVVEKLDYESLFTQQFDTSWLCNECGQRKVKNDRYEHWLNFHSSEIVLCRNCPKQFIFVSEMVLHDYFRHGDAFKQNAKVDICEYCNKEIRKDKKKDFSTYKNHLFKYHKKSIHELIESYKSGQKIDIIKVAQIKENNLEKIDDNKQKSQWRIDENIQRSEFQQNLVQTPDYKFICKSCYKILSTKISYYNHWFYHHIKYPYNCEYCARPNCFITDYLTHIFAYHTDTQRDELVQNKIQCNQCGRLMDNKQSYIMHIKKYHEQFIEELFKQNLHKFPQYDKSSQIQLLTTTQPQQQIQKEL